MPARNVAACPETRKKVGTEDEEEFMSKEFSASRRSFMKGAGVVAAGALAASAFGCASKANTESPKTAQAEAASDVPAVGNGSRN